MITNGFHQINLDLHLVTLGLLSVIRDINKFFHSRNKPRSDFLNIAKSLWYNKTYYEIFTNLTYSLKDPSL